MYYIKNIIILDILKIDELINDSDDSDGSFITSNLKRKRMTIVSDDSE